MDDSPLTFKSADHFAQALFLTYVIADEPRVVRDLDLGTSLNFDQGNYERHKFVYLVAIIAITLTERARRDNEFVTVLSRLRRMVRVEMQNRWGDTADIADTAIEEAAQDCTILIFTPPETDRALSLTWPQRWLKRSGVEETNPVKLFKISQGWKEQYLTLAEVVRRAQL